MSGDSQPLKRLPTTGQRGRPLAQLLLASPQGAQRRQRAAQRRHLSAPLQTQFKGKQAGGSGQGVPHARGHLIHQGALHSAVCLIKGLTPVVQAQVLQRCQLCAGPNVPLNVGAISSCGQALQAGEACQGQQQWAGAWRHGQIQPAHTRGQRSGSSDRGQWLQQDRTGPHRSRKAGVAQGLGTLEGTKGSSRTGSYTVCAPPAPHLHFALQAHSPNLAWQLGWAACQTMLSACVAPKAYARLIFIV